VGYKIEEIRGAHLGIAGLEYRYQVAKLPSPVGGDIYLTAIGNVGNAWRTLDDLQDDLDLRYGGSLGLGIDSIVGPILLDYSLGDGGRQVVYLNIGYKF
jgi:outer membrane translocation and assembly module TamA